MGFDLMSLSVLACFGGFVILFQWRFIGKQHAQIKELIRLATLRDGVPVGQGQFILTEQENEMRRNQPAASIDPSIHMSG